MSPARRTTATSNWWTRPCVRKRPPTLRVAYAAAAAPALQSLKDFSSYLATRLAGKTSDWRLGKDNYERKCRYTLHTGRTPAQLLAAAETDLAADAR